MHACMIDHRLDRVPIIPFLLFVLDVASLDLIYFFRPLLIIAVRLGTYGVNIWVVMTCLYIFLSIFASLV